MSKSSLEAMCFALLTGAATLLIAVTDRPTAVRRLIEAAKDVRGGVLSTSASRRRLDLLTFKMGELSSGDLSQCVISEFRTECPRQVVIHARLDSATRLSKPNDNTVLLGVRDTVRIVEVLGNRLSLIQIDQR